MMNKKPYSHILYEPQACCEQIEIPTKDELAALNAMRDIKEQVRKLKKQRSYVLLSRENEDSEEAEFLERKIVQLKADWKRWEERHQTAVRERMILLGHIDP